MARPRAKELTERELEIMHLFWEHDELTAHDVRDRLAKAGRELAYTTVATLIKILLEKQFIEQTNEERPFTYQPIRSFDDVSGNFLTDILDRVFRGSREQLLIRLIGQKKLSAKEAEALRAILQESDEKKQTTRKKRSKKK